MSPYANHITTRALSRWSYALIVSCSAIPFAVYAGGGDKNTVLPQLAAARPGTLAHCPSLTDFQFTQTAITSATPVSDGAVTTKIDGVSLVQPAHCVVTGQMNPRTGIDGKPYAINFEMRLPVNWNGRFFHQANGGNAGVITTDITR